MTCPKCGAGNADGAAFCGLCFERFTAPAASPAVPAAPKPPPDRFVFPSVTVEAEGWRWTGPLVALPDGLLFFVGTERFQGGLLRRAATLMAGDLGGLAGGAVVDSVAEAGRSRGRRPAAVKLRHRQEAAERYHAALAEAPDLVACATYFELSRAGVAALSCLDDGVQLEASGLQFEVRGAGDWAAFKRAAAAWRYPLLDGAPARPRRRWAYLAAGFLAVAGGVAGVKEVYEAAQLNAKLAKHDGVSGIVVGEGYVMADGSLRRGEEVPWSERLPLYRFGLIVGFLVLVSWLFSLRHR